MMKKTVSYLLTAVLILSTFVSLCLGTQTAAASGADDPYFEDNTNWGLYINTALEGNASPTYEWCKIQTNTNADYVKTGASSIRIEGNSIGAAIPLTGLATGTIYTFSFYYYGVDTGENASDSWFKNAGIYKAGTTIDQYGWHNANQAYVSGGNATGADGSWHKYSVTFTADGSALYYLMHVSTNTGARAFYLDDFKLEHDDPYFETYTNWGVYNGTGTGTVDGTAPTVHANWSKVTTNTTADYVKSGVSSLKLYGNCVAFAVPLTGLQKGVDYTLSFYYRAPQNEDDNQWFTESGIYSYGTVVDNWGWIKTKRYANGANGTNAYQEDGSWQKYSITFTADGSQLFFGLNYQVSNSSYSLYLDDFSLEVSKDLLYFEQNTNWGIYRNNTVDGSGTPDKFDGWCYIETNTDASYIKSGDISLHLHGNTINCAIPLAGLEKGMKYTLSFYYNTAGSSKENNSKTWFDKNGILTTGTLVDNDGVPAERYSIGDDAAGDDNWNAYSITFTATDTQLFFALRIAMSGGYDLYLDEFSLTKGALSGLSTAYNGAAALRNASTSTTGKNGLRIYNSLDKAVCEDMELAEFGALAIRTGRLNTDALTLETAGVAVGVAFSDGTISDAKSLLWENTDTAYIFTAYLTNIPAKYYGADYSIRTYAKAKDGSVYYGDTLDICVFEIANAIDRGQSLDGNAPTEADREAFGSFVTAENAADYADWCAKNNLSTGTLYDQQTGSAE